MISSGINSIECIKQEKRDGNGVGTTEKKGYTNLCKNVGYIPILHVVQTKEEKNKTKVKEKHLNLLSKEKMKIDGFFIAFSHSFLVGRKIDQNGT